jgi:hypothetical protein
LFISSNPPGCEIIINGKSYGTTDKEIRLPVGAYHLTLRKEGYLEWSKNITITPGPNPALSVRLIPAIFGLPPIYILGLGVIGILVLLAIIVWLRR